MNEEAMKNLMAWGPCTQIRCQKCNESKFETGIHGKYILIRCLECGGVEQVGQL
jgi:phage FluMu protein Com